jgi:DNA-binding transcriptional ArsR family regulator
MSRQAVTKHLVLLEEANLISSRREGREKLHFINPMPIQRISERWVRKFEEAHLRALSALRISLEGNGNG